MIATVRAAACVQIRNNGGLSLIRVELLVVLAGRLRRGERRRRRLDVQGASFGGSIVPCELRHPRQGCFSREYSVYVVWSPFSYRTTFSMFTMFTIYIFLSLCINLVRRHSISIPIFLISHSLVSVTLYRTSILPMGV